MANPLSQAQSDTYAAMQSYLGKQPYNAAYDANNDGKITLSEVSALNKKYQDLVNTKVAETNAILKPGEANRNFFQVTAEDIEADPDMTPQQLANNKVVSYWSSQSEPYSRVMNAINNDPSKIKFGKDEDGNTTISTGEHPGWDTLTLRPTDQPNVYSFSTYNQVAAGNISGVLVANPDTGFVAPVLNAPTQFAYTPGSPGGVIRNIVSGISSGMNSLGPMGTVALAFATQGLSAELGAAMGLEGAAATIAGNTILQTTLNGGDVGKALTNSLVSYAGANAGGLAAQFASGGELGEFLQKNPSYAATIANTATRAALTGQSMEDAVKAATVSVGTDAALNKIDGFSKLDPSVQATIRNTVSAELQGKDVNLPNLLTNAAASGLTSYALSQNEDFKKLDSKYQSLIANQISAGLMGRPLDQAAIKWAISQGNQAITDSVNATNAAIKSDQATIDNILDTKATDTNNLLVSIFNQDMGITTKPNQSDYVFPPSPPGGAQATLGTGTDTITSGTANDLITAVNDATKLPGHGDVVGSQVASTDTSTPGGSAGVTKPSWLPLAEGETTVGSVVTDQYGIQSIVVFRPHPTDHTKDLYYEALYDPTDGSVLYDQGSADPSGYGGGEGKLTSTKPAWTFEEDKTSGTSTKTTDTQTVDTGTGTDVSTPGYSNVSGTDTSLSGYSNVSGTDVAASGYSNVSGTDTSLSGYSNVSGTDTSLSGYSNVSGTDTSLSGYSNVSGTDVAASGYSNVSGTDVAASGYSGLDGASGASGYSGLTGASGASGYSGLDGASGYSGLTGASGASGYSGLIGASGASGYSGLIGASGASGYSGLDGASGYSGLTGASGASGYSGLDGASGASGYSGLTGASGASGYSGLTGASGYSGLTGASGYSGARGLTGAAGASATGNGTGKAATVPYYDYNKIYKEDTPLNPLLFSLAGFGPLQKPGEGSNKTMTAEPTEQDVMFGTSLQGDQQPQQQELTSLFGFAAGGHVQHPMGEPEFYSQGGLNNLYVEGRGDGTSDDVPAMVANNEYVLPADIVSSLGNGSSDAGASILDQFVKQIRSHKHSNPPSELPPDSLGPLEYLSMAANKKGRA